MNWFLTLLALLTVSKTALSFSRFQYRNPYDLSKEETSRSALKVSPTPEEQKNSIMDISPKLLRRSFLISSTLALGQFAYAQAYTIPGFKRINTQFIAALGDPKSNSGTNVNDWGLWVKDPGPRGVWLSDYDKVFNPKNNEKGIAPAGWTFKSEDWWLEEHGLIMEAPQFPMPRGKYLVTGGRSTTTVLTVGDNGSWKLDEGTLFDVTHLPCRSARYRPTNGGSPATANRADFPVKPGAEMPAVSGCDKQDYAVLFVIGVAA